MDGEAADLDVVDDDGGVQELAPVEDAEAEVVDGDQGLMAVEVVGVELEAVAGDLEAAGEDHVELGEFDAAVEAVAEGLDNFGFEHGAGATEEDVAGDERGDGEDSEDGADPQKSDNKAMMAAATDGRSGGFDGLRCHFEPCSIVDLGAGLCG